MDLPSSKHVTYPLTQGKSANLHYNYSTIGYTDPYLKSLVQHIRISDTYVLRMCEILRSAGDSLIHHGTLGDDDDFSAIEGGLKQYI